MALILILDDRATNRNIYARLAAAIEPGIAVEVFADPTDALEWLQANRVDLVITDYRMPGMDGAEFTRRFRALPGAALVPVMVVTAYDDRSFRLRALDAGATDFLQTPIDHFELVTRARNLLALGRQTPAPAVGLPLSVAGAMADRPPPAGPEPVATIPQDRSAAWAATRPAPVPGGTAAGGPAKAGPASRVQAAGEAPLPGSALTWPAFPTVPQPEDFAGLLHCLPALVSVTDRGGICRYANAALAAELGHAVGDLVGRPAILLVPADRAARSRQDDLAVFETGRPAPPRRQDVVGPDGTRRTLLTLKTPLRDDAGGTVAVLTMSFEVPTDIMGIPDAGTRLPEAPPRGGPLPAAVRPGPPAATGPPPVPGPPSAVPLPAWRQADG